MSEATLNFHIQARLEQFRVPTELIRANFKSIQRLIEKQKKSMSDDIGKIKKNPKLPPAIKLEMVRKLIKGFELFEKRLQAFINKDEDYQSRIEARLDNLNEIKDFTVFKPVQSDPENKDQNAEISSNDMFLDLHNNNLLNWYRDQTNLLLVDYLTKTNTRSDGNIGIMLLQSLAAQNPRLLKLVDYDLFDNFNKVYSLIVRNHDLAPIVGWFNENRNALKKINSNLEFEINYCKILSLIENEEINEAIKFSQENLSLYGNEEKYQVIDQVNRKSNLTKLKEIGGLLIYVAINGTTSGSFLLPGALFFSSSLMTNTPRYSEYRKLLSAERWENLGRCFIENFTQLYGISQNFPLFVYLLAGMASLKTKSCYCNLSNSIFYDVPKETDSRTFDPESLQYRGPNHYYDLLGKINHCPVCSPELFQLARNLPYAELITNIFNNPFMLPNGNIYPFEKLASGLRYGDSLSVGLIVDPLTNQEFQVDQCHRVYPA